MSSSRPTGSYTRSTTPNDPRSTSSGPLNNTGQSGGTAGADIGAVAAWNVQSTAPSVIVAIVDSGIRLTHSDLAGNLWTNPSRRSPICTASMPWSAPPAESHRR